MRVGINDRDGIQQALDQGADGILVPYINTAQEAREAVSATLYPTGAPPPTTPPPACLPAAPGVRSALSSCALRAAGTRSVYFPQRSMNKKGLLGPWPSHLSPPPDPALPAAPAAPLPRRLCALLG